MRCKICGTEVTFGKFCPECGTKITEEKVSGSKEQKDIGGGAGEKRNPRGMKESGEKQGQSDSLKVHLNDSPSTGFHLDHSKHWSDDHDTSEGAGNMSQNHADKKALISLILGILAFVTIITIIGPLGCGIASIILGALAFKDHTKSKGQAMVGIVLSGVSIILVSIVGLVGLLLGFDSGKDGVSIADNEVVTASENVSLDGDSALAGDKVKDAAGDAGNADMDMTDRGDSSENPSELISSNTSEHSSGEGNLIPDSSDDMGSADSNENQSTANGSTEQSVMYELQYGTYLMRFYDGGYCIGIISPAEGQGIASLYAYETTAGDRYGTFFKGIVKEENGTYAAYGEEEHAYAEMSFSETGMVLKIQSSDVDYVETLNGSYELVTRLESPYIYDVVQPGIYVSDYNGRKNTAEIGLYTGPPSGNGCGYLRISCQDDYGGELAYFDGLLFDNYDGTYTVRTREEEDYSMLLAEFVNGGLKVTILRYDRFGYEGVTGFYELDDIFMAP